VSSRSDLCRARELMRCRRMWGFVEAAAEYGKTVDRKD
jgi:hypothetical protein